MRDDQVPDVYSCKEAELTPNTPLISRITAGWNRLPMGSFHPGITQFVYIDGSVHNITDGVSRAVYQALATVNGGEVEASQE